MSREPKYPDNAPVDGAAAAPSISKDGKKDGKRGNKLVAGAAIGIGSAAIVAALLYANRSKKNDKGQ